MKKLAAILMIGVLHAVFAGAQTDSSVHVKAFPGNDVGTKIANAMLTCPARADPVLSHHRCLARDHESRHRAFALQQLSAR